MNEPTFQWTVTFNCPVADKPASIVAYPERLILHTNRKQLIVNCPRCGELHTLDIPE
jgi:transcription elongation factor Elf1